MMDDKVTHHGRKRGIDKHGKDLKIKCKRGAGVTLTYTSKCTNLIWQVYLEYFPVWVSVTTSACQCYYRTPPYGKGRGKERVSESESEK